jgi:hypothetical protein
MCADSAEAIAESDIMTGTVGALDAIRSKKELAPFPFL